MDTSTDSGNNLAELTINKQQPLRMKFVNTPIRSAKRYESGSDV